MKKVYEITKYVLAESPHEAIHKEASGEITDVKLTTHSADLFLDSLHTKAQSKNP